MTATSVQKGDNDLHALDVFGNRNLEWFEVFKRVDDPQDLYSLHNTCIHLRNLLEPSKWNWGVTLILSRIAPYLSTKRTNLDEQSWMTLEDWTGLLKYRLLSKTWCKAIDDFLASPCDRPMTYERKHRLINDFKTTQAIEQFQERFQNWRSNPFPGRAVAFSSTNRRIGAPDPFEYRTRAYGFIEDFGQHLHSLVLDHHCLSGNLTNHYEVLHNLLTNLSNLRSLVVLSYYPDHRQENAEVVNYLRDNPLPPLPHLEHLELCHPEVYHHLIAKYAPQLKSFVCLELWDPKIRPLVSAMTRLENLAMVVFPHSPSNFEHLSQLPLTFLKSLNVFLIGVEEEEVFHMDKLLQVIRHCPLKTLNITAVGTNLTCTEAGLPLDEYRNESIQFFSLEHTHRSTITTSFNFLEALRKVEVIELSHKTRTSRNGMIQIGDPNIGRWQYQHPPQTPERIRLNEYFYQEGFEGDPHTKMYQSNIWELVPSLKTLHVHGERTLMLEPFPDNDDEEDEDNEMNRIDGERRHRLSFQAWYSRTVFDQLRIQNA